MYPVRYKPIIGAVMLVMGIATLLIGGEQLLSGILSVWLSLGILMIRIGYASFTRPYFSLTNYHVHVPEIVGPVERTYDYGGQPERIKLDGGRLMIHNGTAWKRVPVRRWIGRKDDWQQITAKLQRGG